MEKYEKLLSEGAGAVFKLIKSANTDSEAAFKLGLMYLNGEGVKQDTQKARFYLDQASRLGHLEVEALYGFLYKYGAPYFAKDLEKAAIYFEVAGLFAEPMNEVLLWEAINLYLFGGEDGEPIDEEKGFGLLLSMGEHYNIVYVQYLLGEAYEEGLWGQKKDKDKSNEWYAKAKEQGCVEAGLALSGLPF